MRRDGQGAKGTRNAMGIAIYKTCRCAAVVVVDIGAVYAPTSCWCTTIGLGWFPIGSQPLSRVRATTVHNHRPRQCGVVVLFLRYYKQQFLLARAADETTVCSWASITR